MRAWQNAWDLNRKIHQAYDSSPRAGGRQIGMIKLTDRPYYESLLEMPESDLIAEGGLWQTRDEFISFIGGDPLRRVAVIRFEFTRQDLVLPEVAG
jgi:hypothetical protein